MGEQPRRGARAEQQKTGRHGVKGARVAHLAGTERPPRFRDDVVARPPLGLVDQQNAVGCSTHLITLPAPPNTLGGWHPVIGTSERAKRHRSQTP